MEIIPFLIKYLPEINLIFLILSILSCIVPWNGNTITDMTYQYDTVVSPASYTYGFWGILFGCLLVFAIGALLPSQREKFNFSIGGWMIVISLLQGTWAILWCYRLMIASASLIIALWILLLVLNLRIYSSGGRWFRYIFHLWLSWITVVTFINITIVAFYDLLLEFSGDDAWAFFVVLALVSGEMVWSIAFREVVSVIPITWYLYGFYFGNDSFVATMALVFAVIFTVSEVTIVAWMVFTLYKKKKSTKEEATSPAIPIVTVDSFHGENDNSVSPSISQGSSTNAATA